MTVASSDQALFVTFIPVQLAASQAQFINESRLALTLGGWAGFVYSLIRLFVDSSIGTPARVAMARVLDAASGMRSGLRCSMRP